MSLTKEEIKELRSSKEFKDAYKTALAIHRNEHDPAATHFRDCVECKSGFVLLLFANLEQTKKTWTSSK